MKVARVVYGTDLTRTSEPAWREALLVARLFEAEVVLVHAVPTALLVPPGEFAAPELYRQVIEAAREHARAGIERLQDAVPAPVPKIRYRIEPGPPALRILEAIREEAGDLVVVGTHGRTGLRRVVLGSVADRLVRLAPCPVLTVGAQAGSRRGPRPTLERIVYATDFSPSARAAWPWVVALARAAGAEVDLVHVTLVPAAEQGVPVEVLGRMAQALDEEGRANAEAFLRDGPLDRERVHVVVGPGVAADQVLRVARTRAADLVVMGTHGWSGVLRWMLGSVAQHVVQAAPCPVLTVGPAAGPDEGA
jgi:nucleotide-binding universal stress UspA family protein